MADKVTTPTNPMKEAVITVKFTGVKDEDVKAYFEGKKIVSKMNGKGLWTFTYKARGAAKNDIKKRLDTLTRETGSFEITTAIVTNLEPKAKAPKAKATK